MTGQSLIISLDLYFRCFQSSAYIQFKHNEEQLGSNHPKYPVYSG